MGCASCCQARQILKGSLLQNGFCTNFSNFEAKSCSPKNAPKNAPKNGIISPNFSTRIFPRILGVCFSAVRTVNATEKRPPKNSAKKSIAGTEQNPECRCGRGGSLSTCPFEKQNFPQKTENFFSSQFCTSLSSNKYKEESAAPTFIICCLQPACRGLQASVDHSMHAIYHYTQNEYRTELYSFRIIFGNSCSVITEPICFWN